MKMNKNYLNLQDSYLFSTIAKKVAEYQAQNPEKKPIRLGIGDVTLPLVPAVVAAMQAAVAQMSCKATFRGYGPEQGYDFLRQAIAGYYAAHGVTVDAGDVFVSDGAKSDLGNILDLFDVENTVLIPDPVYPVYVDTNIMAGRRIVYMNANEENGFLPLPNVGIQADIIYLCSPNNPTGAVYNHEQLKAWVDYALANNAVVLFDAAYEAFIQDETLPRSIYEIEGAKQCAIEFCSLSKTAGFTGTRCGYTIVPAELTVEGEPLRKFWLRRQATKFNGVPYVVQCGAQAVFGEAGQRQIKANIAVYQENAKIISGTLREMGVWFTGGENSPYIWLKCPSGMTSWEFFDRLLTECSVVGTPGSGFGKNGEGFFRLTAFGDKAATEIAMKRLQKLF
ncbi:LL-diaminopimelate aminotransferase [Hydrogenoanaerobacterium sp.]|uniref:LL-diaminopimelate aminotransferase n=1 Tax=Hydrogenoanaerobacterium sp. TaxID=2953763 RepID=UPI00289B6E77|nr:LL-diaminopimelate aminotransferase [Hydrogenoanaerobacterium sp.]